MIDSAPETLRKAFIQGEVLTNEWGDLKITLVTAGHVKITSSQISACDPFVMMDPEPFEREVPNGEYPVLLSIAEINDDQRVAFAKVIFAEGEPVSWVMATAEGQDPSALEEGYLYGYGVDAGTGCFADPRALERLSEKFDDDEMYFQVIIDDMEKTYRHTRSWHDQSVGEDLNVVMFSSGLGDGVYASYFGLDEAGKVLSLVTDFGIFQIEEETEDD